MILVHTDETFEAAADAVGITLADLPIVLSDPTHPSHQALVNELTAAEVVAQPV